jgi:hypothetical protein
MIEITNAIDATSKPKLLGSDAASIGGGVLKP